MDNTKAATKADIQKLENDIQRLEEHIQKLEKSTKADSRKINADIKFLRKDNLKIEGRVENLEDGQTRILIKIDGVEERLDKKIDAVNVKLDKIINTLDGFVGRVDNLTTDNVIGTQQIHELGLQVSDHEKRLKSIESSKHVR